MSRSSTMTWRVGPGEHDVIPADRPRVMGILNATPDSFSDGGLHFDPHAAIAAGRGMIEAGADIIDIGGESTRPGADRIPADEQIRRTQPIVAAIAAAAASAEPRRFVSIDTTLGPVAEAALDAGASIINDVAAGTEDAGILSLAAARTAGLVLMHRARPPERDQYSDRYAKAPQYGGGVDTEVAAWLAGRVAAAVAAGCDRVQIAVDPGLGFGKSVADNYALIAGGAVAALGRPVLHGSSRKSFIGAVTGRPDPADRLAGSLAAALAHIDRGATMVRVHDVAATVDALAVHAAVGAAGRTGERPADRDGRPGDGASPRSTA